MKTPTTKELANIDLIPLHQYIDHDLPPHFRNDPGKEAYAYYAWYASQLPEGSIIADLGTLHGLSALAFSNNEKIKVETYDLTMYQKYVANRENIEFIRDDIFNQIERILCSDLILVDVDPHDGEQERKFLEILVDSGYKGITLWDDIHINPGMESFWRSVPKRLDPIDVTRFGHYTGTGLILFS